MTVYTQNQIIMVWTFPGKVLQKMSQKSIDNHIKMTTLHRQCVKEVQNQIGSLHVNAGSIRDIVISQEMEKYEDFLSEMQLIKLDISSVMEMYFECFLNYLTNHSVQDVVQKLEKQTKYMQFKVQTLQKPHKIPEKQKKQTLSQALYEQLKKVDTTATFFRFCPPVFDSRLVPTIQKSIDDELQHCIINMINQIQRQFQQFQDIYAVCLNQPQTNRLLAILQDQYKRGKQQIIREGKLPSNQQIISMHQIYLQVRGTLQELRNKAKDAQNNHYQQFFMGGSSFKGSKSPYNSGSFY